MAAPFVVDPTNYDKFVAIRDAAHYVESFLDLNGIARVREYLLVPDPSKKPPGKNPWHDNGWYWNGVLFVNINRARPPTKTPGFAWSFTGFKADMTAPGILAHETGHHIHFEINKRIDVKHQQVLINNLKLIAKHELPVSGYEPNPYEVMAEMCRLFILNPNLLRVGRPIRYVFLTQVLKLQPSHDVPWRDVLRNAHPKIISAAESWINKCTSTSKNEQYFSPVTVPTPTA